MRRRARTEIVGGDNPIPQAFPWHRVRRLRLIPRLDRFRENHPAIPVNITTGIYEWPDAIGGGYDLVFGCGPECPEGWEATLVVPATMTQSAMP